MSHLADKKGMKSFVIPFINLFFSLFILAGCASKLSIQSEPSQADVFVAVEGQLENKKIGQTPVEIMEPQLLEMLKLSPESTSWIEVTFKKDNFETKTIYMPSSRFGESSRIFKIKLKPMEDNSKVVTKMMRLFFNAKKFAETKQYEQAHTEIDKVISMDSNIAQAFAMKAGIYFLQGNMDLASQFYSKALTLDPSFSEAIKMLEKIKNKGGGQ